ncbi:hypothetical protein PGQ11_002207 [Apiospora arundinis]|uniref:Uncharacterized protein n=1 Tax=Apiospora arundinis TaxID=335852 RepID=A0ABR2JHI2_9PEZI
MGVFFNNRNFLPVQDVSFEHSQEASSGSKWYCDYPQVTPGEK